MRARLRQAAAVDRDVYEPRVCAQPTPQVVFLDVDEGYEWVGGATLALTSHWQHIAMDYVYTLPSHKGHEIQVHGETE